MSGLFSTNGFLIVEAVVCLLVADWGLRVFLRWSADRLLDIPNARSSHVRPTPRGGGVVVVIIIALALTALVLAGVANSLRPAAIAAAALIALVGGIDDVRPLSTRLRLLVQFLCAVIAIMSLRGLPATEALSWVELALAVFWVAALTNAYNFMDGIDGIAGSQAIVAGAAIAAVGGYLGARSEVVTGIAVAAASAGFLLHNWSPARVFMGDVGSAFLGFLFATMTVAISRTSTAGAVVIIASLWPFWYDTSFTLVRRALRGENVFAAHRSHLYQRLVIAGWSHASVTLLYSGMALLGAVVAFPWSGGSALTRAVPVITVLALALWMLVVRRESIAHDRRRRVQSDVSLHG